MEPIYEGDINCEYNGSCHSKLIHLVALIINLHCCLMNGQKELNVVNWRKMLERLKLHHFYKEGGLLVLHMKW